MTIITPNKQKCWLQAKGSYDVTQDKRRLAITVTPDSEDNIAEFETTDIFDWLLMDNKGEPMFDTQLTDKRQIIDITYEEWTDFPSNKLHITYEITFDPYRLFNQEIDI